MYPEQDDYEWTMEEGKAYLKGEDEMIQYLNNYCESFHLNDDEDIIVADLQSYPLVSRMEITYSILRYREYKRWDAKKILEYYCVLMDKVLELSMVNKYRSFLEKGIKASIRASADIKALFRARGSSRLVFRKAMEDTINPAIDLLNKYNESYSINADQDSILANLKTYDVKTRQTMMYAIFKYRSCMGYENDKIAASIVHI